jgi:7-carboxy-7-deazaguanine synthase
VSVAERTRNGTTTFPVVEVFGPTVQGEGALAGVPSYFVRLGGCDYRCSWCDSMFAVDPELVREAERLSAPEIVERLGALRPGPRWVTLSGGNPALWDVYRLVGLLGGAGYLVAVETQGSYWRRWLRSVDHLTVSPKPPSSGMSDGDRELRVHEFMERAAGMEADGRASLKIVVFDAIDLTWAAAFAHQYATWPLYLSCGTDVPLGEPSHEETLAGLSARYRWLCEAAAADPAFARARILPQCHVVAWGHLRAV